MLLVSCEDREPFHLVTFDQNGQSRVRLNEPLLFRFSDEIDRTSIRDVRIKDEQDRRAEGIWTVQGRDLCFMPRYPTALDCSDSGFKPGGKYIVEIAGFPLYCAVRSTRGGHLKKRYTLTFQTVPEDADEWDRYVDPEPDTGPRLLAVGDVPFEDVHLAGIKIRAGESLALTFSEPIYPPSVARSRARLHLMGGEGALTGDPVTLELVSRIVTVPDGKGAVIRVEPRGGFQEGNSYKLWRDAIDFTDFGGNTVETASFSYISIDCLGDSPP